MRIRKGLVAVSYACKRGLDCARAVNTAEGDEAYQIDITALDYIGVTFLMVDRTLEPLLRARVISKGQNNRACVAILRYAAVMGGGFCIV